MLSSDGLVPCKSVRSFTLFSLPVSIAAIWPDGVKTLLGQDLVPAKDGASLNAYARGLDLLDSNKLPSKQDDSEAHSRPVVQRGVVYL
jgi:hypothetical protein